MKTWARRGEPQRTLDLSWEEIQTKQAANTAAWGLGSTDRWDVDLEAGFIRFSNEDGFHATAPVQVVGTYVHEDGSWLWAWDNPSVDEHVIQAALLAREFGRLHDLSHFTTRKLFCSADDCWRFAAVALHLSQGSGAYRGPTDTGWIYMTFGEVVLSTDLN